MLKKTLILQKDKNIMRYFVWFGYKGTAYHGWQHQPNGNSVQDELEHALSLVLREPIAVTAAGRTDAGVHALRMAAHFDIQQQIDERKLVLRLNSVLPKDIAVSSVERVADDKHARFDAKWRRYEYRVINHKSAFDYETATFVHTKLDFDKMNEAAALLLQYTDFASFCKVHTDVKTTLCKVTEAHWTQRGDMWVFTIQADRFLRNMVRAIVGTLFEVGQGKMDVKQFDTIIKAKNRSIAGQSAPAQGLFFVDAGY